MGTIEPPLPLAPQLFSKEGGSGPPTPPPLPPHFAHLEALQYTLNFQVRFALARARAIDKLATDIYTYSTNVQLLSPPHFNHPC